MLAGAGPTECPVALGILGAGYVSGLFATAVAPATVIRIVGVASRDAASAARFAAHHRIPQAYTGYDEMLADRRIEAVYLGVPNSLHAHWAIRAAEAGKHVLCEKPLAVTLPEARRMSAAAARTGTVLLEAFPFHFQPQTLEVLRRIEAGEIGTVRVVQASTGFSVAAADSTRLSGELQGGALLDVGCYPVSLARLVFGARPVEVSASMESGGSAVDLTTVATLRQGEGGLAQIACSLKVAPHRCAFVGGSNGAIETAFANHTDAGSSAFFRIKRGSDFGAAFERIETGAGNGFRLEAEAFARLVRGDNRHASAARLAMSLDNVATMDAIRLSARTGARQAVEAP